MGNGSKAEEVASRVAFLDLFLTQAHGGRGDVQIR
jgi:hypothetical protein